MNIFDTLAPIETITSVARVRRADKLLVLDDSQSNSDVNTYLTGSGDPATLNVEGRESGIEGALVKRFTQGIRLLERRGLVNVTNLANWRASSDKIGNPISQALNDNAESFWQSDGSQPHQIDIYFRRRVDLILLAMFFSLQWDESYTPRVVQIYAGYGPADARFYKTVEVRYMNGWAALRFQDNRPHDGLLKCKFLRLVFPLNHENGKDTHLRGIRLYSKATSWATSLVPDIITRDKDPQENPLEERFNEDDASDPLKPQINPTAGSPYQGSLSDKLTDPSLWMR